MMGKSGRVAAILGTVLLAAGFSNNAEGLRHSGALPAGNRTGSASAGAKLLGTSKRPDFFTAKQGAGLSGSEIRFVALGDTGTARRPQFRVAGAIARKCAAAGCDFILLLGDVIYDIGVRSAFDLQWKEKFELPYDGLRFPFYVVLGNHDYAGNPAQGAHFVAYGRRNRKFVLPAEFYSFEAGQAVFLALSTDLLIIGTPDQRAAAARAQGAHVASTLAKSAKPWRIAFGHHPYISNGEASNSGLGAREAGSAVRRFFRENLCGRADVYLAAHDHNLQVLPGTTECPMLFIVAGGGGHGYLHSLADDHPVYFQRKTHGFAYFRLTPEVLTVEMITGKGTVAFRMDVARKSRSVPEPSGGKKPAIRDGR